MTHSETTYSTETQPQLYRVFPLPRTAVGLMKHVLIPIESRGSDLGILLGEDFSDRQFRLVVGNVKYIRAGKRHTNVSYFDHLEVTRDGSLIIVRNDEGQILPLPSIQPYTLCEVTGEEFENLRKASRTEKEVRQGIDTAIDLLSSRTDFSATRRGFPGFRKLILMTPHGYADQARAWYDMAQRLKSTDQ